MGFTRSSNESMEQTGKVNSLGLETKLFVHLDVYWSLIWGKGRSVEELERVECGVCLSLGFYLLLLDLCPEQNT